MLFKRNFEEPPLETWQTELKKKWDLNGNTSLSGAFSNAVFDCHRASTKTWTRPTCLTNQNVSMFAPNLSKTCLFQDSPKSGLEYQDSPTIYEYVVLSSCISNYLHTWVRLKMEQPIPSISPWFPHLPQLVENVAEKTVSSIFRPMNPNNWWPDSKQTVFANCCCLRSPKKKTTTYSHEFLSPCGSKHCLRRYLTP